MVWTCFPRFLGLIQVSSIFEQIWLLLPNQTVGPLWLMFDAWRANTVGPNTKWMKRICLWFQGCLRFIVPILLHLPQYSGNSTNCSNYISCLVPDAICLFWKQNHVYLSFGTWSFSPNIFRWEIPDFFSILESGYPVSWSPFDELFWLHQEFLKKYKARGWFLIWGGEVLYYDKYDPIWQTLQAPSCKKGSGVLGRVPIRKRLMTHNYW